MRVLCLGASRTGTTSLRRALDRLDLKAYGFAEGGQDKHSPYWNEALAAKFHGNGQPYGPEEFRKLLADYSAVTDVPCILFMDELLETYPDAKIVVTNRDVESWLRSMESTVYVIMSWKSWWVLALFDRGGMGAALHCIWTCFDIFANGSFWNREKMRQGFLEHYAHVRALVPLEKRLEFQSSDGWEPLCKFLHLEAPSEKYPSVNNKDELIKTFRYLWRVLVGVAVFKTIIYGGVIGAVVGSLWYY